MGIRRQNGEPEVRKLSKVSFEKQTDKEKQALNGMTEKAVSNYPLKMKRVA
jgi:hypothetical protein